MTVGDAALGQQDVGQTDRSLPLSLSDVTRRQPCKQNQIDEKPKIPNS